MLKHHEFRAKPGKMKELVALYKELAARADVVVPNVPHRVYREAVGDHDILHVFKLVGSVGGAFWLFTGVCILSLLFGLTMMPETRGRTLEEIARSWRKP